MTWRGTAQIRDKLVGVLNSVAITDPSAQSIIRTYATPPGSVSDVPCVIIYPPAVDAVDRPTQGLRIKRYRVRLRCLVIDRDLDVGADIADAFREALIDAFDSNVTLSGTVVGITGPEAEEAKMYLYNGKDYTGVDLFLGFEEKTNKAFTGGS